MAELASGRSFPSQDSLSQKQIGITLVCISSGLAYELCHICRSWSLWAVTSSFLDLHLCTLLLFSSPREFLWIETRLTTRFCPELSSVGSERHPPSVF